MAYPQKQYNETFWVYLFEFILILHKNRAFTVQTQACVSDHNDVQIEDGTNNRTGNRGSKKTSLSSANNATGYQTFENEGTQHISFSHEENCVAATGSGRKIALRDFFTVLALSFHSVFEGLAIGLEPTSELVLLLFAGNTVVINLSIGDVKNEAL